MLGRYVFLLQLAGMQIESPLRHSTPIHLLRHVAGFSGKDVLHTYCVFLFSLEPLPEASFIFW